MITVKWKPSCNIPTYKPQDLTKEQQLIYDMVAKFADGFMPDAVWSIPNRNHGRRRGFYSSGKTLVEGWRILGGKGKQGSLLPLLKEGESVRGDKYELLVKQTKAPPRYSENTLLSVMETAGKFVEDSKLREAMKKKGLGTPATRADIIEKLVRVGYIQKNKKILLPTKKGIEIIEKLSVEDVKSPP